MRGGVLLALAAVPACLSTPREPRPDDGDGGAADASAIVDAAPDAAGPRCPAAGQRPAATAWPPAGIVVRAAQAADVDGDGINDLVVAVAPTSAGGPEPSRVHVLYGPLAPTGPWSYHTSLDVAATTDISPWAIALDDWDGDGCLELAVAGPGTTGGQGFVAVWRHDGDGEPWQGSPLRRRLTRPPDPGPLIIARANLSTDPALDLIVAALEQVDVYPGATLAALTGPLQVDPPSTCGTWGYINGVRVVARGDGRDQLLAIAHYRITPVQLNDNGTPVVPAACTSLGAPITLGTAAIDLDGAPPDDVLVGGSADMGAYFLAGATGAAPTITPASGLLRGCPATPRGSDGRIEGFAIADLGGVADPELVLIDHEERVAQGVGSTICLLDAITADGGVLEKAAFDEQPLGTRPARGLVIDSFGGTRPRIWTLDDDGVIRCFQRGSGPVLAGCG